MSGQDKQLLSAICYDMQPVYWDVRSFLTAFSFIFY